MGLDNILHEIRYGDLKVTLDQGRIVSIPEQEVIYPTKIENIEVIVRVKKAVQIESNGDDNPILR